MTARERFAEIVQKVDGFFARVHARYPGDLACAPGCDDCCRRRLSVTGIEADAIERALAAADPGTVEALARRARSGGTDACAALEADGQCAIYEARPLVCRSHGVPIRFAADDSGAPGHRSLPVVDACWKNFTGRELDSVEADCVLDQATLSTVLAAIDTAFAAETGGVRGARFDLAEILARPHGDSAASPPGLLQLELEDEP